MTEKTKKKSTPGKADIEVTFKCRVCGQRKPVSDMRSVTRFVPVMIVCQDCAKKLR